MSGKYSPRPEKFWLSSPLLQGRLYDGRGGGRICTQQGRTEVPIGIVGLTRAFSMVHPMSDRVADPDLIFLALVPGSARW